MTLLFKIIRAAHANGTHHKLALDALAELDVGQAEAWRKVFLKHAELFLEGSKAPDKDFKDFRNHVLHVSDNYWGGAPQKVQNWYNKLVRALGEEKWAEAAYAAGVLSHYYTDPVHPFHTAQSEAESNIHRAVEWSISKSYDALRNIGLSTPRTTILEPGTGEKWVAEFACRGAEFSNAYYEKLIAHYDFKRGVVEPTEGFDDAGRLMIAELIMYASRGFSILLGRAIEDAVVAPPAINLTADTVLASLKIPVKWVVRKMSDVSDRRQVEQMYDELMETGRVDKALPDDDRQVRDLYAKEVGKDRDEARDESRRKKFGQSLVSAHTVRDHGGLAELSSRTRQPVAGTRSVAETRDTSVNTGGLVATLAAAQALPAEDKPLATLKEAATQMRAAVTPDEENPAPVEDEVPSSRLSRADDVVDAPSIGPKTATRLNKAGIMTVADLLDADPGALSETVDARHITARAIRDWQFQAQLVIDIAGITGTAAQLLVGAGYSAAAKVRDEDGETLVSAVRKFAETNDGQRILRSGKIPEKAEVQRWHALAQPAKAA